MKQFEKKLKNAKKPTGSKFRILYIYLDSFSVWIYLLEIQFILGLLY